MVNQVLPASMALKGPRATKAHRADLDKKAPLATQALLVSQVIMADPDLLETLDREAPKAIPDRGDPRESVDYPELVDHQVKSADLESAEITVLAARLAQRVLRGPLDCPDHLENLA